MKKLIIPFVFLFLASCTVKESGKEVKATDTGTHAGHEKIHPGRDTTELKWQLDSSTRANMAGIRTILSSTPKEEAMAASGVELKNRVSKLLTECRMKGADHDALHSWLEGFMQDLALLNDGKENSKDWIKLQEDMKVFDRDFY